uniref:hypothetical protein n=1 Tax=Flavobacterium sp. TaxID=239 RepID=UPI00404B4E26
MKKTIILVLITMLISCSKKVSFSYETKTKSILYTEVENPVIIKYNNNKAFEATIDNASLTKINDTLYTVFSDNLNYSTLILKQGKKTDTITFRKILFPAPELRFNFLEKSDTISFSEFRKIKSISSMVRNFPIDCKWEIVSLEVTRIDKYKNVSTATEIQRILHLIEVAEDGDFYFFHNFKIKMDGSNRILNGKSEEFKIIY